MTDTHTRKEDFPLAALWQSGGEIDVGPLVQRLQRQNRRLRRLNQLSFLICIAGLLILLVMEFAGQLPTRGLLSLIGSVSVAGSWWKYRKDRARLIAAYSEEPAALLPFLIKRTRAMRNLGRYYYICPLPSVLVGYLAARLSAPGAAEAAPADVLLAVSAGGLAVLAALIVWGIRLARQKSLELAELEAMHSSLAGKEAAP